MGSGKSIVKVGTRNGNRYEIGNRETGNREWERTHWGRTRLSSEATRNAKRESENPVAGHRSQPRGNENVETRNCNRYETVNRITENVTKPFESILSVLPIV